MAYGPPPGPPPQQGVQQPESAYQPFGANNEGAQGYAQQQQQQQYPPPAQQQYGQEQYSQQQQPQYGQQPAYQMQQSQPYAAQAPAQSENYQNIDYSSKPNEGERFRPKKVRLVLLPSLLSPCASFDKLIKSYLALTRCLPFEQKVNDPIPLALFLATVFGYAALSGVAIRAYSQNDGLDGGLGKGKSGSAVTLNASAAYLLCLVGALALYVSHLVCGRAVGLLADFADSPCDGFQRPLVSLPHARPGRYQDHHGNHLVRERLPQHWNLHLLCVPFLWS